MKMTFPLFAVLAASALTLSSPAKEPASPSSTAGADEFAKKSTEPPPTRILHFKILTPAIAITFDDGPDPKNTPRLLGILKERGIKATFYLLGKSVNAFPQIVREIVADGHEIGNHTWDHKDLSRMSDANCLEELQKTQDAIASACTVTPGTFRPPYGKVKMSQRKEIMEKFHYPAIIWEVDTEDWKKPFSSQKVHDTILKDTKPGSIILCHDIHAWTVDAMPSTLDELKAKGFQFKTISEMIKLEDDERSGKVKPPPVPGSPATASPSATPPASPAPKAKPVAK
jgi:peptidoglycan/xylan/chitin deacetylase (PgdA/CDA1 family)